MNKIKTLLIILIAGLVNSANASDAWDQTDDLIYTQETKGYVSRIIESERVLGAGIAGAKAAIAEFNGKIDAQSGFSNLTPLEIQNAVTAINKILTVITLDGQRYTTSNYSYIDGLFSVILNSSRSKGCICKTKKHVLIGISGGNTPQYLINKVKDKATTMLKQGQ